jgi:hypothetical protein
LDTFITLIRIKIVRNVFISVNNCTGKFLGNVDLYRKLIPKKFMADETPALTMFL